MGGGVEKRHQQGQKGETQTVQEMEKKSKDEHKEITRALRGSGEPKNNSNFSQCILRFHQKQYNSTK